MGFSPRSVALALVLSIVALVVACRISTDDSRGAPKEAPAGSSRAPASSPPFDVGAIRTQFHFAFRREESGATLFAGHASHKVVASAGGFSLEPVDLPTPGKGRRAAGPASSPLRLDPASITRGGAACAGPPGVARIAPDGSLAVDRGPDVEERLHNDAHGVEQSFTFARAPGGEGDLVVRIPVRGESFAAKTASGLHFRDPATGRGVAYGTATWVDAHGEKTAVAPAFDGEAIVLSVPSSTVSAGAYPATLDPNVSPEHEVDQPIFASFGPGVNAAPAIDVEGSRYFVVWSDVRDLPGDGIFGIHVGQTGAPIESVPITISGGFLRQPASPAYDSTAIVSVAFDGQNHLVAYTDQRADGHLAISARRVSAAGVVLDATPLQISPPVGADAISPGVAFVNGEYMVVWSDGRNAPASTSDVFATRVTTGGSILNASSIKVSGASGDNTDPKIAAGGGGSLYAVWTHDDPGAPSSSIKGALLTASGIVVASDVDVANYQGARNYFLPSVAGWGGGFLVAYMSEPIAIPRPVPASSPFVPPSGLASPIATAIGTNGQPTGSTADVLSVEFPANPNGVPMFSGPSVAFDGTAFTLVYSATNKLNAQSVSTDATLVGNETFLSISDDEQLAPGGAVVAASTNGTMAVAHSVAIGGGELVSAPIAAGDGGPSVGPPTPVSLSSNFEFSQAVAFGGGSYLVTWMDQRNEAADEDDVYGVILDGKAQGVGGADGGIDAGYPLADAFPIAATPNEDGPVAAAWDGDAYLVAYNTASGSCPAGLAVKRVSATGQIIGDTGTSQGAFLACLQVPPHVDVTWDGAAFLVAYQGYPTNTSNSQIFALHVTRTSAGPPTMVEAAPVVVSNSQFDLGPAVASAASGNAFIVWRDNLANLVGRFVGDPVVSPGGAPPVSIGVGAIEHAVVYDTVGASYRLAWIWQNGSSPVTLSVASAVPGTVSAATDLAATPWPNAPLSLAFDGKESLVVWTDDRTARAQLDIYGARLDLTGALVDPAGFPIAANPAVPEANGIAAGGGGGATLVTYIAYTPDRAVPRLHARVVTAVTNEGPGAACTGGGDCASGFCVDGVCCDKACGGGAAERCAVCAAAVGATADGTCTPRRSGAVCRTSSGDCDLSEQCDGTSAVCPPDVPAGDGTLCSAGVCAGGVCVSSFDAGVDAGVDAAADAGSDAAADGATDAGDDGGSADAGEDAATADASPDGATDAATDAGLDAGARDAAADAAGDAAHDATADAVASGDASADAAPPIQVLDAAPPATSDAAFDTFPPASGGCGCRAAGDAPTAPAWPAVPLLGLIAVATIRRRRVGSLTSID